MLAQYKQMEQLVKTMGGNKGLLKTMAEGKQSRGGMHPNQKAKIQNQMSKLLPPGMLQQLGGVQGLQNMMQQMEGGAGGMPNMDMSAIANMMGGGGLGALGNMMSGPSQPARKSKSKRK
jgi:signal recognition particle subunit SRP54